jgi:peptidyl-prolyl cis-trans isomerase C
MPESRRTGLCVGIIALVVGYPCDAQQAASAPAQATAKAVRPAILDQVVATVNGQPITRGELLAFLMRNPSPPGNEKQVYEDGINYLANFLLISQFLDKQPDRVTEKELDAATAEQEKRLKEQENRDFKTALAEAGISLEDFRSKLRPQVAWKKYVERVASDETLKKYAEENRDAFSRAQVKASHILILVPPDAPAGTKEAARKKLLDIKKQIEAGQISFADAANKYSEDDANKSVPSGGDVG